jgi:hypothetical protein
VIPLVLATVLAGATVEPIAGAGFILHRQSLVTVEWLSFVMRVRFG